MFHLEEVWLFHLKVWFHLEVWVFHLEEVWLLHLKMVWVFHLEVGVFHLEGV